MRYVWTLLAVGLILSFANPKTADAMRKPGSVPGIGGNSTQLGKVTPRQPLTAAQQATIKRRIMAARQGLNRIHVTGSTSTTIPTKALDAFAEWRDNGAEDVEIWYDPEWGTPHFIKGEDLSLGRARHLGKRSPGSQAEAAYATFGHLPDFLGLQAPAQELRIVRSETDDLGMTHLCLQQTYKGHDVWARDLYVHYTKDGRMNVINGRWVPTPSVLDNVEPVLTEQDAVAAVKRHFSDYDSVETSDAELVVYVDQEQTPWWAWSIRTSLGPVEGYDVFIDAVAGEYLHQVSFVYSDGPVVGSGVDLFGETRTVHAYETGGTYYMINTTKPMFDPVNSTFPGGVKGGIVIGNLKSGIPLYEISNNPHVWDSAAVSSHSNLSLVYEYFLDTHGRNSIDGYGGTLKAIVNDETVPANAMWTTADLTMRFGSSSSGVLNMAAALDVTGHEMAHGIIAFTSGLAYEYESGALNESFADIFGTLVEFYAEGDSGDWLNGEDVALAEGAFRSMSNPEQFGQPQRYSDFVAKTRNDDHGGVHTNSGIPNYAFYLIAEAIGRNRADSIFYRALGAYMVAYSQFVDLRIGVTAAADDLFPGDPAVLSAIFSAFDEVEIFDAPGTVKRSPEPVPMSNQWIVAIDHETGRLARYDTSGALLGLISSAPAAEKPSVPDSGQWVFFIDIDRNARVVASDGTGEVIISAPGITFAQIASSPNGRMVAYDIAFDPTLYVLDLDRDTTLVFALYTPSFIEGYVAYNVIYPHVLEWSIDGRDVFYDCLCANQFLPGTLPDYWDIFALNIQDGVIERAVPGLPVGQNIGNPTLSVIRHDNIVFDLETAAFEYHTMGVDRFTNRMDTIVATGVFPGRPSLAPDDGRLVYEWTYFDNALQLFRTNLWTVDLDSTGIKGTGNDLFLVQDASHPNWRFEGRDQLTDVTVEHDQSVVPETYTLHQNYPNPFNASTVITFETATWGNASLDIFNVLGQKVSSWAEADVPPGRHTVTWDGRDDAGNPVASGVYIYRVTTGEQSESRKMVLVK